jgi:hypothetical protein
VGAIVLTDETHDPLQFLNQLRQALAAPKLSVGFLIGAGCPVSIRCGPDRCEPLIPDVKGLSVKVFAEIAASAEHKDNFQLLLNIFEEDGEAAPNIELLLGKIRSLSDVAGKASVRGLSLSSLASLDKRICADITKAVDREYLEPDNPYLSLARFVESRSRPATEIFTTNYDLLLESALETQRVPFFDGFVGSVKPFFDQRAIDDDIVSDRWCRLWKLHGSINWRLDTRNKRVFRSRASADGVEQLIHPSHHKYDESRRMPYFVMIDRFRNFIRNQKLPVAMIVNGYSFGDQHINEALVESLKANPSAVCYALQFGELAEYPDGALLAKNVSNLSLLASDGAIIRRRAGKWATRAGTDQNAIIGAFSPLENAEGEVATPCKFVLGDFIRLAPFLDQFISSAD